MAKRKEKKLSDDVFLSGPRYLEVIKSSIMAAKRVRMAVAFWGDGAIDELGLKAPRTTEILCNLTMGGTNPHTIEQLIEAGFAVKHSPWLHGKVFLFGDHAIVGSANASCNGLGFEGREVDPWDEAGVVVRDEPVVEAIVQWMDERFDEADEIKKPLLDAAKEAWAKRRFSRPTLPALAAPTLMQLLKSSPHIFVDRPLYLTCDTEPLDKTGLKLERDVQKRYGTNFEIWQNWKEMPREATMVSFEENDDFDFLAIYLSDSKFPDERHKRTVIQIAQRVPQVEVTGVPIRLSKSTLGPMEEWRALIGRVKASDKAAWRKEAGCCVAFSDLAGVVPSSVPLIEINHASTSGAEWTSEPTFDWGSKKPSFQTEKRWKDEGVWLWDDDAEVARNLPIWVLHCETSDWRTINTAWVRWYRLDAVLPSAVRCKGERMSLGVNENGVRHDAPFSSDDAFKAAFRAVLAKHPEVMRLLGLSGGASRTWSRTGSFDAQLSAAGRIEMSRFWAALRTHLG